MVSESAALGCGFGYRASTKLFTFFPIVIALLIFMYYTWLL